MTSRIISSLLGLPIAFFIILKGGLLLKLGTIFVSFVGLFELYRAVSKKFNISHIFGFIISLIYILTLKTSFTNYIDVIFITIFIPLLLTLVFLNKKISCFDVALALFGFFYITFMFSTVYLTRSLKYGQYTVWLPFICAWLCDTGAYFTGITIGKHKLTPNLSPKKTVEGAIGGLLLATLGSAVYGFFINNNLLQNQNANFTLFCTIAGFVGAVFSQFGDLTASSIKRKFNVKDFGTLIPGHGGILDRFDSIIFSGAVIYVFSKLFY